MSVMELEPAEISRDYVTNKKQFQLHNLITEQRHEKTYHLSELANRNVHHALSALMRQVKIKPHVKKNLTHLFQCGRRHHGKACPIFK